MESNDSFAFKTFFEQWLTRLIALSIFAYLIYSLIFKEDAFSGLHIGALVIMLALLLVPMASRLKLLNFIDYNSKLNNVMQAQRETGREINELKNQISVFVSPRINPIQIITTEGFSMVKELLSGVSKEENELKDNISIGKDRKEDFLQRSWGYISMAYVLLVLTMTFQVAIRKHREIKYDDYVHGETIGETITNLLEKILSDDLDKAFPIKTMNEKTGETSPLITPETIEGLQLLNSLIDLRQKVKTSEIELPSPDDIKRLFSKIQRAIKDIGIFLQVIGTKSILYRYAVEDVLDGLIKGTERENSK